MATKIKEILSIVPQDSVLFSSWLCSRRIDRKEQTLYVRSGWLERITKGVYKIAGTHPSLYGPATATSSSSLTVLFEDPFWICLFELADQEGLRVCKVTFGAEPSEREIMQFVDRNWHRLRYSQAKNKETHRGH